MLRNCRICRTFVCTHRGRHFLPHVWWFCISVYRTGQKPVDNKINKCEIWQFHWSYEIAVSESTFGPLTSRYPHSQSKPSHCNKKTNICSSFQNPAKKYEIFTPWWLTFGFAGIVPSVEDCILFRPWEYSIETHTNQQHVILQFRCTDFVECECTDFVQRLLPMGFVVCLWPLVNRIYNIATLPYLIHENPEFRVNMVRRGLKKVSFHGSSRYLYSRGVL